MKSLLCLGFGYCAQETARQLEGLPYHISATARKAAPDRIVYQTGQVSDALKANIATATHILISVSPDAIGCPVYRDLAKWISQSQSLEWLGYLSTTGVYGDYQGAWVNESSACNAKEPRSIARIMAEKQWLSLYENNGITTHIFRLSGIYGVGRNVFASLRDGTAQRIDAGAQVFSRAHVEDIAHALIASMQRPMGGEIFNIADDEPASSADVIEYGARLLGLEPPPIIALAHANLSEMAQSFYRANRRVEASKIKQAYGLSWRYPTYREGLLALINSDER